MLVLLPIARSLFPSQTPSLFPVGAPNSTHEVMPGHSNPLISTADTIDSASPQTLEATSWSFTHQLV